MNPIRKWLAVALVTVVLVGGPLVHKAFTSSPAQPNYQMVEWPGRCC